MTQEQIQLIEKHSRLIQQVINQNYRVEKSNDTVKQILAIAKELNGNALCKTCPHVIEDAFRLVWMEYKKAQKENGKEA